MNPSNADCGWRRAFEPRSRRKDTLGWTRTATGAERHADKVEEQEWLSGTLKLNKDGENQQRSRWKKTVMADVRLRMRDGKAGARYNSNHSPAEVSAGRDRMSCCFRRMWKRQHCSCNAVSSDVMYMTAAQTTNGSRQLIKSVIKCIKVETNGISARQGKELHVN